MKDTTAIQAMMQCLCPRCRNGRMFTNSGFNLKYGRRLNQHCPVCNLRFEREPAFFEGAMYFNYAMNVALMVTSGVATYVLLNDPGPWVYFGISASAVVLMVSFTSRLSKSLMLHLFGDVDYEPEIAEELKK